jgi:hypothetical protein
MDEGKKPEAGTISGAPQMKIVYAVIAVAIVILAVVLVAKFGYNTDLLNPAGGQMSLVQRPASTIVPLNTITLVPTTKKPGITMTTPPIRPDITVRPRLCPSGQTSCGGVCRDLQTDPDNCGSCGTICDKSYSGSICVSGICKVDCSVGYDCNNNRDDGCEKPMFGDSRNCHGTSCYIPGTNAYGLCENLYPEFGSGCAGDLQCNNELNPWDVDCSMTSGAQHVNIYSDVNNCGGCGSRCSAGQICDQMKCKNP